MSNFKYVEELLYTYNKRDCILRQFDLDMQEMKLVYMDGGVGAIDYSKDRVQSSSNNTSSVESQVLKAEREIEKINKKKHLKEIHYNKLEIAMLDLNEIEQQIIKYRYSKERYTWSMCSRMIGMNRTSLIEYRNKMVNRIIEEYNIKIER